MTKLKLLFFITLSCLSIKLYAQHMIPGMEYEDDFNVGGDIFNDFNEDLEASQVMEDERYYRYGRFFGVNLGLGYVTFSGNRGLAYNDNPPAFHISTMYFFDFLSALDIGIEYTKHTMIIDTAVAGSPTETVGAVDVSMIVPYIAYRYYVDTSDLGTAITYSNPYFVGRFEYWYQTNKFRENKNLTDESGGGVGVGLGIGLEFPIEIKKTYFNVEFLWHNVNFFDKYTDDFRQIPADQIEPGDPSSDYGYDSLTGYVYSLMCTYNITW